VSSVEVVESEERCAKCGVRMRWTLSIIVKMLFQSDEAKEVSQAPSGWVEASKVDWIG
jgi:hypothetical protein